MASPHSLTRITQHLRPAAWLYAERLLRIFTSLFTTALIARYLGAAGFGDLAFVLAFIAILAATVGLGLENILISRLAIDNHPDTLVAEAIWIRTIAAIVAMALAFFVFYVVLELKIPGLIYLVLTIAILPLATFEQLLYAKSSTKIIALAGLIEMPITLALRLTIVFLDLGMAWVALSFLTESILRSSMIAAAGRKLAHGTHLPTTATSMHLKKLFLSGLPLLVAGLAVTLYMKTDQLMIRHFLGAEHTGVYAAAVRLVEASYFLPMILSTVLLPFLSKEYANGQHEGIFIRIYNVYFYTGLLITLVMVLFGGAIVRFVFGSGYIESARILAIYSMSVPFIFLGIASGKWLIIENLKRHAMFRTLIGLSVNLILNLVLIPIYGLSGAAIATVISQFFATFLYDFLTSETRPMGAQKVKAISWSFIKQ